MSEVVKDVLFVIQLLRSMKISFKKLPIMVRVDNVGVIFMINNITTTSCTKYVDIRYKYMNEYVEVGVVKIIFVESAEVKS